MTVGYVPPANDDVPLLFVPNPREQTLQMKWTEVGNIGITSLALKFHWMYDRSPLK
jgi:hypothetical protein